jgi:hypothetical protein
VNGAAAYQRENSTNLLLAGACHVVVDSALAHVAHHTPIHWHVATIR